MHFTSTDTSQNNKKYTSHAKKKADVHMLKFMTALSQKKSDFEMSEKSKYKKELYHVLNTIFWYVGKEGTQKKSYVKEIRNVVCRQYIVKT